MSATRRARSVCPIASTLDRVGDRWSLLVVRDLLRGKTTFGELLDSPERIPTNILADRLRRLEEAGLIEKSAYQERPVRHRYALTRKGAALGDVLLAIVRWGERHIPGTRMTSDLAPKPRGAARRRASRRSRRVRLLERRSPGEGG